MTTKFQYLAIKKKRWLPHHTQSLLLCVSTEYRVTSFRNWNQCSLTFLATPNFKRVNFNFIGLDLTNDKSLLHDNAFTCQLNWFTCKKAVSFFWSSVILKKRIFQSFQWFFFSTPHFSHMEWYGAVKSAMFIHLIFHNFFLLFVKIINYNLDNVMLTPIYQYHSFLLWIFCVLGLKFW